MESQYSCIIYSPVVYVAKLTCPQLYVLNFHGNIVKKSSKPFSLVSLKKEKKSANTVGDFHSFFFSFFFDITRILLRDCHTLRVT